MPRDLNQVSLTLKRYAVLVSALFQGPGATNPFVQSMWLLASAFHERLPLYLGQLHALSGTPWADVYPAHILRHVQVNTYEYLQALQVGGGGEAVILPELPTFTDLLRDLQRGSFHLSSSWLPLPASVTVDPSTLPATAGTPSVTTRSTRASTAASTVSTLTAATGGGRTSGSGGAGNTSTQGTFVTNPARDAEFDALQLRGQMRDLLRAHPPPANDSGNEFSPGGGEVAATRTAAVRPRTGHLPTPRSGLGFSPMCVPTWWLQLPPLRPRAPDGPARARRLPQLLHPGFSMPHLGSATSTTVPCGQPSGPGARGITPLCPGRKSHYVSTLSRQRLN